MAWRLANESPMTVSFTDLLLIAAGLRGQRDRPMRAG